MKKILIVGLMLISLQITESKAFSLRFNLIHHFKTTGGQKYASNQYTVHKFIENGTFEIIGRGSRSLEYLIVGGGGAGGEFGGGGGGGVKFGFYRKIESENELFRILIWMLILARKFFHI